MKTKKMIRTCLTLTNHNPPETASAYRGTTPKSGVLNVVLEHMNY